MHRFERPWIVGISRLFINWTWFSSVIALIVLPPAAWIFYFADGHGYVGFILGPYTATTLKVWLCIAIAEAPFLLWAAAALALLIVILVCGATFGIVVDAAVVCLAIIMLFVVPELGPLAMILAVSTESVPPGEFRVRQISPRQEVGARETLMHSTTFSDPEALDAIAKIIARIGNAPVRSGVDT
jgi:hypothetical protein